MCFLVSQIQLPLHRQLWAGEFTFRLLLSFGLPGHRLPPKNEQVQRILVAPKSSDKRGDKFYAIFSSSLSTSSYVVREKARNSNIQRRPSNSALQVRRPSVERLSVGRFAKTATRV